MRDALSLAFCLAVFIYGSDVLHVLTEYVGP